MLVAQRDIAPGQGHYPTTAWSPGQAFADDYSVLIPAQALAPSTAHWEVGLWQPQTAEYAFILDGNGEPIASSANFGELTLRSHTSGGTPSKTN
jgi:hypothetical protein